MLNLHINPGNGIFNMYGDYTLIEGSFLFSLQNIITKKFIIESGSMIQWTGEPVDARLDINAVYKLKTSLQPLLNTVTASSDDDQSGSRISDRSVPVDCKIHIGGRLSNPQLDFSVVVPVTDIETQAAVASVLNTQEAQAQQFISLVALGTFSNSGSANIGASSGVATGLEMLTNQLTNWFSTDDYRIILNYRAGSEMTGDEVDFGFSTNLINNRLLVEVEGNYIIDNKQAVSNNVSNFMGEAHVTWLIDKSGNLRLKAFTQTIDRFDENQGLQETGIGISYKEDFNNFKDLKQRIRDRFTNKKSDSGSGFCDYYFPDSLYDSFCRAGFYFCGCSSSGIMEKNNDALFFRFANSSESREFVEEANLVNGTYNSCLFNCQYVDYCTFFSFCRAIL